VKKANGKNGERYYLELENGSNYTRFHPVNRFTSRLEKCPIENKGEL
jgi:hypothetical protein